jgi:hypothetical protein
LAPGEYCQSVDFRPFVSPIEVARVQGEVVKKDLMAVDLVAIMLCP